MNWLTKALRFGEKIKKVFKKRPSKEEIENSNWTALNCCTAGPKLKSELEENFNQEIEELSQETENLVSEIEKWQM